MRIASGTDHFYKRPLPEPGAGREYGGKFILRTSPEHYRMLVLRALQAGASLNAYVNEVTGNGVRVRE